MKFKVLSRNDAEWSGRVDGTPNMSRTSKNTSQALHAPQQALDVQRAITAAKVTRTLARPFMFACSPSHLDGVYSLARSRKDVSHFASASADGEVRLWNMITQRSTLSFTPRPAAFIRSVTFSQDSERLLFCSDAKFIYSVDVTERNDEDHEEEEENEDGIQKQGIQNATPAASHNEKWVPKSLNKYVCSGGVPVSLCASYAVQHFASAASETVQIWDEVHSKPVSVLSLANASDSIHCVRYNPVESHMIASAASDRSVNLYDVRTGTSVRKLVLSHRTNDLSWNPMEAMTLACANDDHNVYTYDIRKLSSGATTIHKDHTGAVMTVDYSPTGQDIVTGSYDKTIRIFQFDKGRSKEVYHTKRMQKVFAVRYSLDAAYVVSGSDDGDVRTWKSDRSRPTKPLFHAERTKVKTAEKLIERYKHIDDVRKIAMKRHVPKHVKMMTLTKGIMKDSQKRKEANVRRHVRPENREEEVSYKKKNIVKEVE